MSMILTLRGREAPERSPADLARCIFLSSHNQAEMTACLESLPLTDIINIMRSAPSMVVMADVSVKDEEFSAKIDFFHSLHSYAMEATHMNHLFVVTHSPCA
jgi:hypothetical protein